MKKAVFSIGLIMFISISCAPGSRERAKESSPPPEIQDNSLIVTVENLDFTKHQVTFIELGADRCIPCKAMQPIMKEIAGEYKGTIQVVFYDVWKNPQYARSYGVQLIPTQVFVNQKGEEFFRHTGFFAKEEIIRMLKDKSIL